MNVTYLIGAGASAEALPVVAGFEEGLMEFWTFLNDFRPSDAEFILGTDYKIARGRDDLKVAVLEVAQACERHASIDTYAKKLYIRGETAELKKVKIVLSLFLAYKQRDRIIDKRYDSFFATILQEKPVDLPDNIKIVSWNYDSQFEIAYSNYTSLELIDENSKLLCVNRKYLPRYDDRPGFQIWKINGTAGLRTMDGKLDSLLDKAIPNYYVYLVSKYYNAIQSGVIGSSISFAWESDATWSKYLEKLKESITTTEILVVIGYSFPLFNRSVDRDIIQSLSNLKKVYFQSTESDAIKERFRSVRNDISENNLIPKNDLKQFLMPDEMDVGPVGPLGMRVI